MPHFDSNGQEQWVCQRCAQIRTGHSTWVQGVGNVCDSCIAAHPRGRPDAPISLTEYCRQESGGLESLALTNYINRYYGHG